MAITNIIEPQTDGEFTLELKTTAGVAITTATVVADVYSPTGTLVATGQAMNHTSGGRYLLFVDPDWSDNSGTPILGEWTIEVTATYSGATRVKRYRYLTSFGETSWDV